MQRILCPIDFSDYSHDVLAHASALVEGGRAKLLVLHVLPPPAPAAVPGGPGLAAYPMPGATGPEGAAETSEQGVETDHGTTEDRIRRLAQQHRADCEALVRQGAAAEVIVEVAKEAGVDQIVMGTHGRTGWRRVLLGSTAEAVVREAPCAVTVVKREEPTD